MERVPVHEFSGEFPEIARDLDEMVRADQEMRIKSLKENVWDDKVDFHNTARMKEIVAQIGWPTISKVGKEGSNHAWLLVQHADLDVEFQKQCLELMKAEPEAEIARRNIAMLEDRVRVNTSQPQVYGTQFRQDTGEHKPLPIEDEVNVNARRASMGMEPLEDNIAEMYKKYGTPEQG